MARYAVQGLFVTGFTVAEVLDIQARAKGFFNEGKTIMSWSDADTSTTKQMIAPPGEILLECAHALKVLDPATYGRQRIATASYISGHLAK